MDKTRLSYIYAGLAVFFWSTVPTAFKLCLRELNILPMVTIASLASTLILLVVLIAGRKLGHLRQLTGKELLSSAFLGLINPFIYYLLLLRAYQVLPAQVAQPLNMIWPIILVFLSVPLLGQNIRIRSYFALLISFGGVYVISSQGHPFSNYHSDAIGILFALGSSVFWAIYFIKNVRDKREDTMKLFLNFVFGTIYLFTAMTVTSGWHISGSLIKGIVEAVYIGFFEMGITFLFWLKALQNATSTDKVSNLVYIAPFLSLIFVHFILHEPVYYTTPVGIVLIISGILIQNRRAVRS